MGYQLIPVPDSTPVSGQRRLIPVPPEEPIEVLGENEGGNSRTGDKTCPLAEAERPDYAHGVNCSPSNNHGKSLDNRPYQNLHRDCILQ